MIDITRVLCSILSNPRSLCGVKVIVYCVCVANEWVVNIALELNFTIVPQSIFVLMHINERPNANRRVCLF